ncbi:hypothetical protein LENED_012161 [Lentinula edodes]|uniref:Uncharacterized protein n=1 Tax=Lentinula edodes TaxID=5353 RepID=A0A1Q3ERY3_LENED|nr:hypothetical protein LENED_012161 [Lentinula edodes]
MTLQRLSKPTRLLQQCVNFYLVPSSYHRDFCCGESLLKLNSPDQGCGEDNFTKHPKYPVGNEQQLRNKVSPWRSIKNNLRSAVPPIQRDMDTIWTCIHDSLIFPPSRVYWYVNLLLAVVNR